jgi:hypothetical protein
MKKIRIMLCAALLLLAGGCGRSNFPLEYVIPPGDGADFYFSDQQIRPKSGKVTLAAGAGFSSATILLIDETGMKYGPLPLTHDQPVMLRLDKGCWYRVGIALPNDSSGPIAASLTVKRVDIRIE